MNTLSEIEAIVDTLPAQEKQELLLFLAARLRTHTGPLPAPLEFSSDQIQTWIADDESEMQRFRDGEPG